MAYKNGQIGEFSFSNNRYNYNISDDLDASINTIADVIAQTDWLEEMLSSIGLSTAGLGLYDIVGGTGYIVKDMVARIDGYNNNSKPFGAVFNGIAI